MGAHRHGSVRHLNLTDPGLVHQGSGWLPSASSCASSRGGGLTVRTTSPERHQICPARRTPLRADARSRRSTWRRGSRPPSQSATDHPLAPVHRETQDRAADHARHKEAQVQRKRRRPGGKPSTSGSAGNRAQERREERNPVPPQAASSDPELVHFDEHGDQDACETSPVGHRWDSCVLPSSAWAIFFAGSTARTVRVRPRAPGTAPDLIGCAMVTARTRDASARRPHAPPGGAGCDTRAPIVSPRHLPDSCARMKTGRAARRA